MFIYLSKKIAIPNGVKLKCVSWNSEQGWIACGGDNGLLKVLKLESGTPKDPKSKMAPASSNLSMNQTLEGHNGSVMVVNWNENYRKLTTSDQYGLIIVWMLHKGMWFEEMINNRNKSVVRDMKWTADGQKICIVYEDGAVIVGSVDGNRLWGKELSLQLALVEWSPDGRLILFCTVQGECHIYDCNGNAVSKLPLYCMEGCSGTANIVGIDWYDGLDGSTDPNAPTLALGLDNGRVQLMRGETDEKAVLIDTGLRATRISWNTSGQVLAVAGSQTTGELREASMVQFYSHTGQHLRTLRVPGSGINALSWEGGGLRIALAVDSYIYFANIRPDYKWGYFGSTLVYAFNKPDRAEHCVMFWDTKSNDRYAKYVKKLINIRACGEYCVLSTKGEEAGQYILILCNAIGSPVDSKYIETEPTFMTMTQYHVIVASEEVVYIWQYRTPVAKLTSVDVDGTASMRRKDGRERVFHIDDKVIHDEPATASEKLRAPSNSTNDPVCAICASDKCLLLGRESGIVNRYSLPHLSVENTYVLRCRPQVMELNSNSSRMSIIDINGVLTFFDLQAKGPESGTMGEHLPFERKDAWDMRWSDDNPELFAIMEKTRMYIFRGMEPEEPILSNGFLCEFSDLQIRAVLLDDVMRTPDHPDKDYFLDFETKSLRDTRHILSNIGINDAYQFIEDNSHPRLWRILAEYALEQLDFTIADKAFVRCADYQGIQFVKRLQLLDDKAKQHAEVAAYFKRFDEAETIYRDIDRMDLAIEMRMRLGDWFKVEKLAGSGASDDSLLLLAWNKIGDYYSDRQKWNKAVAYYAQAKNTERLVECFYVLEDYTGLENLINTLPDAHPLLCNIGRKFMSVGLCEHAVIAFQKGADIKAAIDCCVLLNQWDQAVELAEKNDFGQIEAVLSKYANYLLEKQKPLQAVELYRKAQHHTEAAKLLSKMATEAAALKVQPLRTKKLYVLAAMEVERFRKKALNVDVMMTHDSTYTSKTMAAQTLDGLMTLDQASSSSGDTNMENAWHGAEAFHFWLLAHRQLYDGDFDGARRTSLLLQEFEDVLDPVDIHSFIALASFYSKYYGKCSKAFIKLESSSAIPSEKQEQFAELAISIFTKHPPQDPSSKGGRKGKEAKGGHHGKIAQTVCVASGKEVSGESMMRCKHCKHVMINTELRGSNFCPLCHGGISESLGGMGGEGGPGSLYPLPIYEDTGLE
ncbi:WD repeat-containing protein 35 [Cymbomonas tetramitiformis]|uniref:WD repeat-containing protein 35 n=1 Tax=Cymbomonas tetramitiformis TaxID=36881 RepID=A0AAE0BMB7_9CHLO|nr:WD repeat-containing protein 35 [Cymbomonas tetramitiformis]